MFHATTSRMAASTPIGMWLASGAAVEQDHEQRERVDHADTGVRAPARMFVAVRAMAPVAGSPPKIGGRDVGDSLRDQLDVRVVAVAGHPVGDDGRHQRLDGAQHRDRERRPARASG
jgi:hypothetical protein